MLTFDVQLDESKLRAHMGENAENDDRTLTSKDPQPQQHQPSPAQSKDGPMGTDADSRSSKSNTSMSTASVPSSASRTSTPSHTAMSSDSNADPAFQAAESKAGADGVDSGSPPKPLHINVCRVTGTVSPKALSPKHSNSDGSTPRNSPQGTPKLKPKPKRKPRGWGRNSGVVAPLRGSSSVSTVHSAPSTDPPRATFVRPHYHTGLLLYRKTAPGTTILMWLVVLSTVWAAGEEGPPAIENVAKFFAVVATFALLGLVGAGVLWFRSNPASKQSPSEFVWSRYSSLFEHNPLVKAVVKHGNGRLPRTGGLLTSTHLISKVDLTHTGVDRVDVAAVMKELTLNGHPLARLQALDQDLDQGSATTRDLWRQHFLILWLLRCRCGLASWWWSLDAADAVSNQEPAMSISQVRMQTCSYRQSTGPGAGMFRSEWPMNYSLDMWTQLIGDAPPEELDAIFEPAFRHLLSLTTMTAVVTTFDTTLEDLMYMFFLGCRNSRDEWLNALHVFATESQSLSILERHRKLVQDAVPDACGHFQSSYPFGVYPGDGHRRDRLDCCAALGLFQLCNQLRKERGARKERQTVPSHPETVMVGAPELRRVVRLKNLVDKKEEQEEVKQEEGEEEDGVEEKKKEAPRKVDLLRRAVSAPVAAGSPTR